MFYLVRANVGESITADKLIPFETLGYGRQKDPRQLRRDC
jgi:hypothetical protein